MASDLEATSELLPDYEILERIGSGSFGVVLRARQQRLDRLVAIKQLPPALGNDDEVRRRFVAEARILSSIDHPHVVPVFDFVHHGDACLLIMELLTGGSLAERRARAELNVADLIAVALAACSGLDAAHERGVLHRDIKPANLLFAASGALKIVDFGIAKIVGGGASLATVAGTVLGSASFMAPEQVLGDAVTPATDVYSLATVLYESLSAQLPFVGDRRDQLEMLMARVEQDPVPLGDVAEVPAEIAAVIMAALDRRPGERPGTAQEFGVALAGAADAALGPGWLRDATTRVFASGPLLEAIGPALTGNRLDADARQARWASSDVRRVTLGLVETDSPLDDSITGVRDLIPVHEVVQHEALGLEQLALRSVAPEVHAAPWVGGFRARLRVSEPGAQPRMVDVDGPTLVGRDADGFAVADLEVSRRHCVIVPSGDGLFVTDLRSSNGTFVAGTFVEGSAVARPGDEIRVGLTTLSLLAIEPIIRRQLLDALDAIVDGALAMTGADRAWLVDLVPSGVRVLSMGRAGAARPAGDVVVDEVLSSYLQSVVSPVVSSDGFVPLGAARLAVALAGAPVVSRVSVPCVAGAHVIAMLEVGSFGARPFDDYVPFVAVLAGVAAALLSPT